MGLMGGWAEWRAILDYGVLFEYDGKELGNRLGSDRDLTPAECILNPLA